MNKASSTNSDMVEILDKNNRPVAVMPLETARYQGLNHRIVMATVNDIHGRAYIRKRSAQKETYPRRLDLLASTHVRAGESTYAAVWRDLTGKAKLSPPRLALIHTVSASAQTNYQLISFFSAGKIQKMPRLDTREAESLFLLDKEELGRLVQEMPELLTPGLIFAWKNNLVFPFS